MNFLAHGEVARRLPDGNVDLTLGAMLPDLTHMLAFQVATDRLPAQVKAGWKCHLAVDKWFHADGHFRSGVKQMSASLVEDGWNRWSAQAAAHVSWELLLDGHLARSSDPSSWFAAALRSGSFRETLDGAEQQNWDRLVEAQLSRPLWQSYRDAAGVADRTWRRLGHTRLAFPSDSVGELVDVLEVQASVIAGLTEELLSSAVKAVSDT